MSTARAAFALVVLGTVACGGSQVGTPSAEPEPEYPCCLDDRWEQPPPEIGQTPPDRAAPPDALEAFSPE